MVSRMPRSMGSSCAVKLNSLSSRPLVSSTSGTCRCFRIEYAEKFALDHRSLDDAFFARLRAQFTDAEIVELTAMIGNWLAFGRFQAVLDVAEACGWAPPPSRDAEVDEPVAV